MLRHWSQLVPTMSTDISVRTLSITSSSKLQALVYDILYLYRKAMFGVWLVSRRVQSCVFDSASARKWGSMEMAARRWGTVEIAARRLGNVKMAGDAAVWKWQADGRRCGSVEMAGDGARRRWQEMGQCGDGRRWASVEMAGGAVRRWQIGDGAVWRWQLGDGAVWRWQVGQIGDGR